MCCFFLFRSHRLVLRISSFVGRTATPNAIHRAFQTQEKMVLLGKQKLYANQFFNLHIAHVGDGKQIVKAHHIAASLTYKNCQAKKKNGVEITG